MASRLAVESTYRPKGYGISPSLARARRPFRIRNALTGTVIASFVVGVWAYSISAVKQDVFDDIDEQARAMGPGEKRAKMSIEDEIKANKAPVQPTSSASAEQPQQQKATASWFGSR